VLADQFIPLGLQHITFHDALLGGHLRHAKSSVTMDIYTHAQDDAKRKALEKFEARWSTENTGRKSRVESEPGERPET